MGSLIIIISKKYQYPYPFDNKKFVCLFQRNKKLANMYCFFFSLRMLRILIYLF